MSATSASTTSSAALPPRDNDLARVLDAAALCALHGPHAGFAVRRGREVRYPDDVARTQPGPFLHASASNTGAIRLYQQLGFVLRRTTRLAALRPPGAGPLNGEGRAVRDWV